MLNNNYDINQSVKDTRDSYKHLEVEVSPNLKRFTNPNEVCPKSCYEKCYQYITSHHVTGIILVHGSLLLNNSIPISHAWVEIGDILFDGVYQRFYDKELYYKELGLVKDFEYTEQQTYKFALETGHYGSWEKPERLVL